MIMYDVLFQGPIAGGKPSKGTPADKRLKGNKPTVPQPPKPQPPKK